MACVPPESGLGARPRPRAPSRGPPIPLPTILLPTILLPKGYRLRGRRSKIRWCLRLGAGVGQQAVADARCRDEVAGARGRVLELAPQPVDVRVEELHLAGVRRAPDPHQELV